ncbi:14726_t:CDS:2 [Entrophospora sp. SA101]|nr:14726_t:CDS:2 [Entrophospora sp. SA101]
MRHSSLRGVGETEKTEKSLPVIDMSELTKKWSDWFEPSVLDWLTHSKDDGNNTENDKKSIRYSDAPSIRLRSTGRPFSLQSIQSILSGNPEDVSDNESDDEDGEEVINHMKITIDGDGDDDTNSNITSETMTPSTYLAKVIEGETVTRHYYNRDLESNINNNNNNLSPYDATNKKSTDLESIVLSTEFSEKSHETINVKPDNNDNEIITNNEDATIISKYLFWSGFLIFPLWWLGSFYLPKSETPATPEDYKWRSRCRKATFYSSTGVTIIVIVLLAIFLI